MYATYVKISRDCMKCSRSIYLGAPCWCCNYQINTINVSYWYKETWSDCDHLSDKWEIYPSNTFPKTVSGVRKLEKRFSPCTSRNQFFNLRRHSIDFYYESWHQWNAQWNPMCFIFVGWLLVFLLGISFSCISESIVQIPCSKIGTQYLTRYSIDTRLTWFSIYICVSWIYY